MARKDISMTERETADFLGAGAKVLQVASLGRDGFPHLAPMWFIVRQGDVIFRSFSKSQKIVNLRRDPRLTVLVEEGSAYEELKGVMIKGRARLVDDPAFILEVYVELARRYPLVPGVFPGDTPDDAVRMAFERFAAKNTAVIVEPAEVVSWDHTKLGGGY
jgi:nitroimidazol reductase NimA-like FMN-containing flavoprotein (pyridoxamine 5'-phosphate oxidase superfamily)